VHRGRNASMVLVLISYPSIAAFATVGAGTQQFLAGLPRVKRELVIGGIDAGNGKPK
jgi:hypothetical protein